MLPSPKYALFCSFVCMHSHYDPLNKHKYQDLSCHNDINRFVIMSTWIFTFSVIWCLCLSTAQNKQLPSHDHVDHKLHLRSISNLSQKEWLFPKYIKCRNHFIIQCLKCKRAIQMSKQDMVGVWLSHMWCSRFLKR